MADIKHQFPAVITLPGTPTISNQELACALSFPSAAAISLWRKERGFPACYRDGLQTFSITTEIERWLRNQGIATERRA